MQADFELSRATIADLEFTNYGFEGRTQPADAGDWGYPGNSDRLVCPLYFTNSKGRTIPGEFMVEFEPNSAQVVDARAWIDGEPTGVRVVDGTGYLFPGL